jgi:outer membrane protein TolC
MKKTTLMLACCAICARAQDAISLKDAVSLALSGNKSVTASESASQAAQSRIAAARGANLPKVNYSESWTRSDNPVFVFSSLLTQHQFGEANLDIGTLNRPNFLNNFQSLITADQTIFNAGQNKHAVRSAELTRDLTTEEGRLARMNVIAATVRSYYDALLSAEQFNAATLALRSAQADLERAENVRSAGLSTDADVLSIQVHLSTVRELQIRREADLDVARAALNDALGMPLDTPHNLTTQLTPLKIPDRLLADYEKTAVDQRPEARQLKLATSLAENQAAAARGSLLPQVDAHGAFEADRQRFVNQGGANWLVSIGLRWNLFNGNSDKARIDAGNFVVRGTTAEQQHAISGIQLQVRRAFADLRAAAQRIEVTAAAAGQAAETLRITQNRYETGLSNVTELLRTETSMLEAQTRQSAAIHDQRVAAIMLELAAGTLTPDSEILNEGSR